MARCGPIIRPTAMPNSPTPKNSPPELVAAEVVDDAAEPARPAHWFKPGQSGNPAGRPPGRASKRDKLWRDAIELSQQYRISPLEYMLQIVNDPRHYPNVRLEAAKAAAPYIHRKQPIAIEGGAQPIAISDARALANLSDADLQALLPLVMKLAGVADAEVKGEGAA